ncbi:glycosyltransferase [Stieleria sp. TO1_6]|uniref:glycosyltransferase n=1 Tax=Stieleria tagensis TaxID=2956795 RepID=UPI00209B9124|nr:glycosyltransferase [Stieleria tagensis]MCO8120558.1 glycosyltransferase [Stieleria tagensis]
MSPTSVHKRPLAVDMLNTGMVGGAAVAAARLHEGLLAKGIDSRLWNKPARRPDDEQESSSRPLNLELPLSWRAQFDAARSKLRDKRELRGRSPSLELFTTPWRSHPTPIDASTLSGDLFHLHWVNRWLDWTSFFGSIANDFPVVWTLHDMNPITGGCHHADGCDAFQRGCGNCPQLAMGKRAPNDISKRGFDVKYHSYAGKNLHIATPSRWLQRHAENSGLVQQATVQTIYNGVDLTEFRPLDKQRARQELGLPNDRTIIGFGAASLSNPRKGMQEFFRAVSKLSAPAEVLCLGFGDHSKAPSFHQLPEVHTTGFLTTPDQLARVYSAADVFVMPSLGENMPQTVVEAMACGTPTVAFRVGGIPEIVIPGETGMLADLGNCDQLGRGIQWMIDHPTERRQMGQRSRELVCREFDLDVQTEKYLSLYQRAIQATDEMKSRHYARSA